MSKAARWLLGLCVACGDASAPVAPRAEPFVVPVVTQGRTSERFEHGIATWFGAVVSPLVVTREAIRLRDVTLVSLVDGALREEDVTSDGVIAALAAVDVPGRNGVGTRPADLDAPPGARGASLAVDPAVPYRTVYAVLETLRRAGHGTVEVQARRDGRPVAVWLWLPSGRPASREVEDELLMLTTTVAPEGAFVSGTGGVLGPGCERITTEAEATVTRRSGQLDFDEYVRCLARVKETFPDESVLRVTGTPSTPFGELVAVVAASGSSDVDELFPDAVPIAPQGPPSPVAIVPTPTMEVLMRETLTHTTPTKRP